MADDSKENLTPNEAGAFAAQWSEHQTLNLRDLAQKLEIDFDKAQKMLDRRRATAQPTPNLRPTAGHLFSPVNLLGAIGGLLIGGGITYLILSASEHTAQAGLETNTAVASGLQPIAGSEQASAEEAMLRKATPNRSANAVVESQGVSIPNDVLIAVHTPSINFIVKGKETRNVDAAKSLRTGDVLPAIRALLRYATDQGALENDPIEPPGSAPSTSLELKVGSILRTMPMVGVGRDPLHLDKLFADDSSTGSVLLVKPLLNEIKGADRDLFPLPKLPGQLPVDTGAQVELERQGIHVPKAMYFSVQAPGVIFTAKQGLVTDSADKAKAVAEIAKWTSQDTVRVLKILMEYAMKRKPLVASVPAFANSSDAFVTLQAGYIVKSQGIHWEQAYEQTIDVMFQDGHPGMTQLIAPFLDDVHKAGANLFVSPKVSPKSASPAAHSLVPKTG